jgi:hypothetical protein
MMTLSGDLLGAAAPAEGASARDLDDPPTATPTRVVLTSSPERPPVDPCVDTISTGLRKFNIGTVPASVTPPGTWRHAAGFTLAASATALVGLTVLSAAVSGTFRSGHGGSAFPSPSTSPGDGSAMAGHAGWHAPGRHRRPARAREGSRLQRADAAGRTARHAAPMGASGPRQQAEGAAMVAQTRAFYREVASDPAGAYRRTGGALHARGRQALRKEYAGVSSISLDTITANPDAATTTSTMRLRYTDGRSRRVTRTCRFTRAGRPRISDERA